MGFFLWQWWDWFVAQWDGGAQGPGRLAVIVLGLSSLGQVKYLEVRPGPSVKVVSLELGPSCPHPPPQVPGEPIKEAPPFNFLPVETHSLVFVLLSLTSFIMILTPVMSIYYI